MSQSNLIDLQAAREERTPHLSGNAHCLACQHVWVAVAPVGTNWLECPSCGCIKGTFKCPVNRGGGHLECRSCTGQLFYVTPDDVYCALCGEAVER